MYYNPIPPLTKHMCRIVVSMLLRHTISNLMHTTPVAERIGGYKILYWTQIWLIWSQLHSDVSDLIMKCSHYTITYRWR